MNTSEILEKNKKDLDEYSAFFLKELKTEKKVDSSLFSEFIKLYAERLYHEFSLSKDLTTLYDYCQNYYNHNFSNSFMNSSEAISGLYSAFWLFLIIYDLKNEHNSEEELITKLKAGHGVHILMLINSNPGIIHKRLAKESGITPSALSQFVSKYRHHRLFSTIAAGREKAYFIEYNGKQLLEHVCSQKNVSKTEEATVSDLSYELAASKSRVIDLESQLAEATQKIKDLEAKLETSLQACDSLKEQLAKSKQTSECVKELAMTSKKNLPSVAKVRIDSDEYLSSKVLLSPRYKVPIRQNTILYNSRKPASISEKILNQVRSFLGNNSPIYDFSIELYTPDAFQDNGFKLDIAQSKNDETPAVPYQSKELLATI